MQAAVLPPSPVLNAARKLGKIVIVTNGITHGSVSVGELASTISPEPPPRPCPWAARGRRSSSTTAPTRVEAAVEMAVKQSLIADV